MLTAGDDPKEVAAVLVMLADAEVTSAPDRAIQLIAAAEVILPEAAPDDMASRRDRIRQIGRQALGLAAAHAALDEAIALGPARVVDLCHAAYAVERRATETPHSDAPPIN